MTVRTKAKARPSAPIASDEAPAAGALARVSPAKIRANRTNASLSTGPRTPEGKRIARWNALRHGVLSAAVVLLDESTADFVAAREHFRADLRPVGAVEELLTDRIVSLAWRQRRLGRVEGEILKWARGEAERIRLSHLSREQWDDERKRAKAEANGDEQFRHYEEHYTESGRKRRKPVGRVRMLPVPVVEPLEFSMEVSANLERSKRAKDEEAGNKRFEKAYLHLHSGAAKAAEEAEKADKFARYERDAPETLLGRAFMLDQTEKGLERVQRYETTLDRAIGRTLDRLLQLQAARGVGGVVLDADAERER